MSTAERIAADLRDSLAACDEEAAKYKPDGRHAFVAGWLRATLERAILLLENEARVAAASERAA